MTRMDSIPDPHQNGKPDPHQKTVWIRNTGADNGCGVDTGLYLYAVLRSRMFIPDIPDPGYEFFHPGSRVKKIPDPGSASKNLSIFNSKNCF
jgi:hypothetical protein